MRASASLLTTLALAFPLFFSGCAQLPNETVTLSDAIGKDLVQLETAHKALVRQYFANMEQDVDDFITNVYIPFIIEDTLAQLEAEGELENMEAREMVAIVSEEAVSNSNTFRQSLLSPIQQQRESLLAELDVTYSTMIRGNAAVTEHLRSIHKINDAQLELLEDLGISDETRTLITEKTIGLSQRVAELLTRAQDTEAEIDALPAKLLELMD